jgi:hypothetical protein
VPPAKPPKAHLHTGGSKKLMTAKLIVLGSLLCSAEIAGSWWVWGSAPTDSIRVWYADFWAFEAGRLHYWLPVFAAVLAIWGVSCYALRRHHRFIMWWLYAATLGLGLEVLTSLLYWRSARSSDLRNLFQSIWNWHRVPQATDLGWPSFRAYLWDHLIPWAAVLLLGITLWLHFEHKARSTIRTALPGSRNG